jgi:putative endonuclease
MTYQYRKPHKTYYVYLLASISRVLYAGLTNNLYFRVKQHKEAKDKSAFTARYRINRLVYYEEYDNIYEAIDREKQIKRWRREKKLNLINEVNPKWNDLSKEWMD